MDLTSLEPQWVKCVRTGAHESHFEVESYAEAQGVTFLCPAGDGHHVCVWFRDRGVPDDAVPGPGRWAATGTSYADLSLSPSIALVGGCAWHGHIQAGKVLVAG